MIRIKRTLEFGKIAFSEKRRVNPVTVQVSLKKHVRGDWSEMETEGPEYWELAITGAIWNNKKTEWYLSGQCLDTIAEYVNDPLFLETYRLWKAYHLNDLHAGTPEQEAAILQWRLDGHPYEYSAACEYLKSIGLYEVPFYGKTKDRIWHGEPYRYGHAWVVQEIPDVIVRRVKEIINVDTK